MHSTTVSSLPPERGAYGFRLRGVDGAQELLVAAADGWPELCLSQQAGDRPAPDLQLVGPSRAELNLAAGGTVVVERGAGGSVVHAVYALPRRAADLELVHPHLATAAAIAARWRGHESFHAGAVMIGDGAWGLLGDKEAGKSSMLAWLALAGHAVLSDDLLVLDGHTALAGPRALDLRESAAQRLGVGEPLGRVGLRDRWRLVLGPIAAEAPLRGWIVLEWHASGPELVPLRGAQRLQALLPHRAVRLLPADPAALVGLSGLPCYTLRRARQWSSLEEAALLLGAL